MNEINIEELKKQFPQDEKDVAIREAISIISRLNEEKKQLESALQSAREERSIIVTNLSFLLGGLGLSDKAPDMTGVYEDEFFSLGESIIKERDTLKAEADRMRGAIKIIQHEIAARYIDCVKKRKEEPKADCGFWQGEEWELKNCLDIVDRVIKHPPAAPEKAEKIKKDQKNPVKMDNK